MSTQEPCDRINEHGKYAGLARAAWEIAKERSLLLDEIERLLDAGENDAAIAAMRRYINPNKKPVVGAVNESKQQGKLA